MNDELFEKLDRLLAEDHLRVLESGAATASDREAIRKYLSYKGYTGPSVEGHAKADDEHPILKLAEWDQDDPMLRAEA